MAKSTDTTPADRFHNIDDHTLADMIGKADTAAKAAESEAKALKEEFKRRGLTECEGALFAVTVTEQIAARLDTTAVRAFLGDLCPKFELPQITNVLRIKPSPALAA